MIQSTLPTFQSQKRDVNNIPPLDVHWVWHSHMLSPTHYRRDCEAICGTVVDHKLLSSEEIQERYESSVKAWQDFCGQEPYDFLASSQKRNTAGETYTQVSSYDIWAAVQRQRNFNYQVSLSYNCRIDDDDNEDNDARYLCLTTPRRDSWPRR